MVSKSDAPRRRSGLPRSATTSGQPDGWFDYTGAYQAAQSAAREYAEWFDQANLACAAWYAWWQAAYGIAPGVAPLAGGLSAWWWTSQNALPFAGVV